MYEFIDANKEIDTYHIDLLVNGVDEALSDFVGATAGLPDEFDEWIPDEDQLELDLNVEDE